MGPRGFERRLENLVEGVFGRVFKSSVRPVEIGRRLIRELDASRNVDVRGKMIAANFFTVFLSEADYEQFSDISETLCAELSDAAREHARSEGYQFVGHVTSEIVIDPELRTGAFAIDARLKEGASGSGPGTLQLPSGERLTLAEEVVTIGRMPGSTITLSDPNVSRNHAEIKPVGSGYVVVDLKSTNGTRVNGSRIASHDLLDGDKISFGNTVVIFEAS